MVKYFGSFVAGLAIGFGFLAMSSCVEKKSLVEGLDAGTVQVVESGGSMTAGVPTISSLPAAVSEVAPVPVAPPVLDGGVSVPETK